MIFGFWTGGMVRYPASFSIQVEPGGRYEEIIDLTPC